MEVLAADHDAFLARTLKRTLERSGDDVTHTIADRAMPRMGMYRAICKLRT
jgi:hypothetical protein